MPLAQIVVGRWGSSISFGRRRLADESDREEGELLDVLYKVISSDHELTPHSADQGFFFRTHGGHDRMTVVDGQSTYLTLIPTGMDDIPLQVILGSIDDDSYALSIVIRGREFTAAREHTIFVDETTPYSTLPISSAAGTGGPSVDLVGPNGRITGIAPAPNVLATTMEASRLGSWQPE
jgi:hypothetical protein